MTLWQPISNPSPPVITEEKPTSQITWTAFRCIYKPFVYFCNIVDSHFKICPLSVSQFLTHPSHNSSTSTPLLHWKLHVNNKNAKRTTCYSCDLPLASSSEDPRFLHVSPGNICTQLIFCVFSYVERWSTNLNLCTMLLYFKLWTCSKCCIL